jgi:hypothetical protein
LNPDQRLNPYNFFLKKERYFKKFDTTPLKFNKKVIYINVIKVKGD